MKLSISLSDALEQPLKAAVADLGAPPVSLLIETAIAWFLALDRRSQLDLLRRQQADRTATSHDAWMRSFWQLLGLEMNTEDRQENELAPRTYGAHIIIPLLPDATRYPAESDGFIIHATPKEAGYQGRSTWTFERGITPSSAARAVAEWIRLQQHLTENNA